MHSARQAVFTSVFIALTVLGVSAGNFAVPDEDPEVTDRVARISSIKGDVSIRRAGVDSWEKAVLNLPVVEGDEITTAASARFEIQFNTNTHVRVAANSYLKIATLNDSGIALSLAEGSLSLTTSKFDASKMFLEIDAPKTTIAVKRSGRYRVDAGKSGSQEIRVSVFDDGEARVYSNNAGSTIRDGRSAKVFIDGSLAGEWENGVATRSVDEFDEWIAERDGAIAKRLSRSNYGQYYDDDIYGADELNDSGNWTYTRDYGYIWRPNRTSLVSYSDWSPYRYGHWRWLPAYGWTWVNDEPWGWATYHHGRWIWYNSGWYWSPYSYYRNTRSWWYPALVVLRVIDQNVCWYPLPYRRRYYNYNHHYYSGRPHRPRPTPRPNPGYQVIEPTPEDPRDRKTAGKSDVPDTGVIMVPLDDFGKGKGVAAKLPAQTARRVITTEPVVQDELKRLPTMTDVKGKVNPDIRADSPPLVPVDSRTGATKRDQGVPLDDRLRNKIIFGNRPVIQTGNAPDVPSTSSDRKIIPATGAVGRPTVKTSEPVQTEPHREPRPQYVPPTQKQEPRVEPTKRDAPRYEPPVRSEPTRSEPTKRSDPPPQKSEPRSEPKSEPSKRSDPPPQK